jgi:hypothetical protein
MMSKKASNPPPLRMSQPRWQPRIHVIFVETVVDGITIRQGDIVRGPDFKHYRRRYLIRGMLIGIVLTFILWKIALTL